MSLSDSEDDAGVVICANTTMPWMASMIQGAEKIQEVYVAKQLDYQPIPGKFCLVRTETQPPGTNV